MIFKPHKATSAIPWNDAVRALDAATQQLNAPYRKAREPDRYEVGNALFNDTTSMLPALHNRCLWIQDNAAKFEDVRVGDIVLNRSDDGSGAIHVVAKKLKRKNAFRTQGINRRTMDRNKLTAESFEWKVVAIIYTDPDS